MASENPFKNVEIVSGNELSNYNANLDELVYLDDAEEELANRISIQIELPDNQNTSTPQHSDEEEELHPLDPKVEPEENENEENDRDASGEPSFEIFRAAHDVEPKECVPIVSYSNFEENLSTSYDEEQFQIVEPSPVPAVTNESGNSSSRTINNIHDHSYSQSTQNANETSFCDEIIDNILKESHSAHKTKGSVELLSNFTKYIRNYVVTDDEQNSLVAQYLTQMSASLDKMQKGGQEEDPPHEQNEVDDSVLGVPLPVKLEPMSVDAVVNSPEQTINDSQDENRGEPMEVNSMDIKAEKVSMSVVREAPLASDGDKKADEADAPAADSHLNVNVQRLKVYVEQAQNSAKNSMETFQKLLDATFVAQDDVDNGTKKFTDTLQDLASTFANILSVFGVSMSDNALVNNHDKDTDDEIDKLCNLSSLKVRKHQQKPEIENVAKVEPSKEKEIRKKRRKIKGTNESMSDDNASNSDLDSILSNASMEEDGITNSRNNAKEDSDSNDEEEKMRKRIADKVKANLLKSSDDEGESDEASYHTSESSDLFDSDAGNDADKKPLKVDKQKTPSPAHSDNEHKSPPNIAPDKVKSEVSAAPINANVKEEKTENHSQEKKPKKAVRKRSFENEIFNKKYLADDDDSTENDDTDDERAERSPSTRHRKKNAVTRTQSTSSNKVDESNEVLDLSAFEGRLETRSVNLDKYFEKRTHQSERNNEVQEQPCDLSKVKQQAESPKKNPSDQNIKQTVPSPSSIDDITYISLSSESDSEISSTNAEGTQRRRRKQLTDEELREETKKAKTEENERVKRLKEKTSKMSQFLSQRLSQSDVVADDDLILDYSEEKDLEIKVHPRLVHRLKQHQIEGVQFMYNNCYGAVDEVKPTNGSGCILAHCMGLGKTLQLITLLHTVIRYDVLCTKRILVICPKSTILNWGEEFARWLNGIESDKGKKLVVKYLEDNLKIEQKIKLLEDWYENQNPSVFLINYESFRILVNWSGTHHRSKIPFPEEVVKKNQARIAKCLLDPGPHLVVCDEGHLIKNQNGATNKAVTKILTKRRIILTGTPVQNALHEYYAMVHWIKPNLLGTLHEFNNIYANPIKNGQNKDSTPSEIKKMKQKSYVLNKNLSTFVQRKDASVLKDFLPIKYEYCISVPLTEKQETLYNYYLANNRNDHMGRMLLPHYTALRKIWTHPKVLQHAHERALKGENKFGQLHQQQQQQQQQAQRGKMSKNVFNEDGEGEEPDDVLDTTQGLTAVTNNWWSSMVSRDDIESLYSSNKMRLLFEILKISEQNKEKILIFSSFVAVLDCIEYFMKAIHNQRTNPNAEKYGYNFYQSRWELGKDYYRLDGSTPKNLRQSMISKFNEPGSSVRCFLISAKAGGQGINLTAANRAIIVDTSWNPANDNQNIFRIYRLGQKKVCYVYRFVAASTMEERVYSRSVTKEAMSHRVVEKKQIARHYVKDELNELFVSYKLKPLDKIPNFPQDDVLRHVLITLPAVTYNFHEHDSLLENKPEDDLDEEEKKEAWHTYMNESTKLTAFQHNLQENALLAQAEKKANMYNHPSSWLMGAAGLGGLDAAGLTSSFFPGFSSSFFANEMFKRIGTYDPLNLYSTPSLSSSATTATASSLISSLLHTHNPISALGNLAPTPAVTSYNANNIPPAASSIFAQPSTSSATTSAAALAASSTSLQSNKKAAKAKPSPTSQVAKQQLMALAKRDLLGTSSRNSALKSAAGFDPLAVPANSSRNLSILPDNNDITPPRSSVLQRTPSSNTSFVISSPRSLNEGTSARTSIVPKKSLNFAQNRTAPSPSLTSAKAVTGRPQVIKPKTGAVQKTNGQSVLKPQALKQLPHLDRIKAVAARKSPQQNAASTSKPSPSISMSKSSPQLLKQMTQQTNTLQKSPSLLKPAAGSPSQIAFSKIQLQQLTSSKLGNKPVMVSPSNKSVSNGNSKQKGNSAGHPSPEIMRQLEKNQTSLTETNKKTVTNLPEIQPPSFSLSSDNSVSIIKLAKTPSSNSLAIRPAPAQNSPAPSISVKQNFAPSKQRVLFPDKFTTNYSQVVEGIKRKNDGISSNSQLVKKIRINPPQQPPSTSAQNTSESAIVELD